MQELLLLTQRELQSFNSEKLADMDSEIESLRYCTAAPFCHSKHPTAVFFFVQDLNFFFFLTKPRDMHSMHTVSQSQARVNWQYYDRTSSDVNRDGLLVLSSLLQLASDW